MGRMLIGGLCGLVACLSLTISTTYAGDPPSFTNKRPQTGGSKNASTTARKKPCDIEPSTVSIGRPREAAKPLPASQSAPFQPVTSAPRWHCEKPSVVTKPVWGDGPIVCEFEIQNTGAQYLKVRAKAG